MRTVLLTLGILILAASKPCFGHEKSTAELTTRAEAAAAGLTLILPGEAPITVDATTFAGLERHRVKAAAHDQPPSVWEGVALVDVLRHAGAPLDQKLRGRELAKAVRVTAADGYQVVFSLAELDAAFSGAVVLLVDKQDGHALGAEGPFRLVAPDDKRPARWVRNVVRIELFDASTVESAN